MNHVTAYLFQLIPARVHNRIVLACYDFAALFKVRAGDARSHYEHNRAQFQKLYRRFPNGYLENQAELTNVKFGTRYSFAHSGCGAIALLNAVTSVKERPGMNEAAELVRQLERNGAALYGAIGIAPRAIVRLLKKEGYDTKCLYSKDAEKADAFSPDYDTYIVSCYNNARTMGDKLHTVNISRDKDGYRIHNGYRFDTDARRYTPSSPYRTLSEAIRHIDPNTISQPIMTVFIRRKAPCPD